MTARSRTARPSARPPGRHVDIVSGSFGGGHDAAATAIAHQLEACGSTTRVWDIVDLLPGRLGRALRSGYLRQIQSVPSTWRWTLAAIERHDAVSRVVVEALRSSGSALLEIAEDGCDQLVSTHPFPSQALGALRADGRLAVPVTTYLTDMSVHRLWVHPGVDLHLAVHGIPAGQARAHGALRTRVVTPAVRPDLVPAGRDRQAQRCARRVLGLPGDPRRPLALVTGGAHGTGRLLESARDLAATDLVVPVVLCGTNTRLLDKVDRHPAMIGLGWTADVPRLLQAVDVVVQNSGGMTSLETQASALPMVTYRCVAGHGEANASALDAAGLAPWAHDQDQLRQVLREALLTSTLRHDPPLAGTGVAEALFPVSTLIA